MKFLKQSIISSIHDSHKPIKLKKFLRQVLVNFGGTSELSGIVINKPESVRLALDKFKMKRIFEKNKIPSFEYGGIFSSIEYPVVVKSIFHIKKNIHLKKVDSQKEMDSLFFNSRLRWEKFYWERFTPCNREFRIHISRFKLMEVFATEKILRDDNIFWIKNKKNCIFKKDFIKPKGWNKIVKTCKKVLRITGLDIAGFDVAVNSFENKFYIIEVNTACGMGNLTRKAYTKELNKIALIKNLSL